MTNIWLYHIVTWCLIACEPVLSSGPIVPTEQMSDNLHEPMCMVPDHNPIRKFKHLSNSDNILVWYLITKLHESGDLCGNIIEFGVATVIHCQLKRSDIAIQHARWRWFCFYILLFNGYMSFQDKISKIRMYLFLYLLLYLLLYLSLYLLLYSLLYLLLYLLLYFFFKSQCSNRRSHETWHLIIHMSVRKFSQCHY